MRASEMNGKRSPPTAGRKSVRQSFIRLRELRRLAGGKHSGGGRTEDAKPLGTAGLALDIIGMRRNTCA
jgi:hypothetical protein